MKQNPKKPSYKEIEEIDIDPFSDEAVMLARERGHYESQAFILTETARINEEDKEYKEMTSDIMHSKNITDKGKVGILSDMYDYYYTNQPEKIRELHSRLFDSQGREHFDPSY